MRCVRCHGLMVIDENRSVENDIRQVDGMRCVNCGYFYTHVPRSANQIIKKPRHLSHSADVRQRRPVK